MDECTNCQHLLKEKESLEEENASLKSELRQEQEKSQELEEQVELLCYLLQEAKEGTPEPEDDTPASTQKVQPSRTKSKSKKKKKNGSSKKKNQGANNKTQQAKQRPMYERSKSQEWSRGIKELAKEIGFSSKTKETAEGLSPSKIVEESDDDDDKLSKSDLSSSGSDIETDSCDEFQEDGGTGKTSASTLDTEDGTMTSDNKTDEAPIPNAEQVES